MCARRVSQPSVVVRIQHRTHATLPYPYTYAVQLMCNKCNIRPRWHWQRQQQPIASTHIYEYITQSTRHQNWPHDRIQSNCQKPKQHLIIIQCRHMMIIASPISACDIATCCKWRCNTILLFSSVFIPLVGNRPTVRVAVVAVHTKWVLNTELSYT